MKIVEFLPFEMIPAVESRGVTSSTSALLLTRAAILPTSSRENWNFSGWSFPSAR
jgi:hypothetical protein